MALALEEARKAYAAGQCPVGAVVVRGEELLATAGNMERAVHDATAHAEILAMRAAGRKLGSHKLRGCTVYTTLEPCPMCEAAMLQAEVSRVVSGGRTFGWIRKVRFNPAALAKEGPIMDQECRGIFRQWLVETGRTHILDEE
jgi:tRNA(adenine34) deaminase